MRHLIVAQHSEPLTWVEWLARTSGPWTVNVVSNGTHRPNVGREAGAYVWWILKNYERLQPWDFYGFVQADPFPHCDDIRARLLDEPGGWQPLGSHMYESDANGGPHHAGLPVGQRYSELVGAPFPGTIRFYAGGQFLCRGTALLRKSRQFWQQLAEVADDEATGGPWVLERLWAPIFGRDAASHHGMQPVERKAVDA